MTRWRFLLIVVFFYLFAFVASPEFAADAFADFASSAQRIMPIILVVFFVMFLVNLLFKPDMITKHLGVDSGIKGWVLALVGSIIISGPPYIIMPMLADLKTKGMRIPLIAVFLSNRSVQPVFLPVMALYFGFKYTAVVATLILIFSIFSGMIIGKLEARSRLD